MATESGISHARVESAAERDLREDPQSFGFFQAIRLLHGLYPEARPVGGFAHPSEEVVRLSSNPDLGFPAGEIQDLEYDPDARPRMEVNFMGLVGSKGVLPTHYSQLVRAERRRDDRPLTDFLDIFQHRMLSLFYAAWERAHFFVPFERGESNPVSRHLLDMLGLGAAPLRRRLQLRDEALLFYCGLLGMRQRGAVALEQLLADYFEAPVSVEQFVGGWYALSTSARCRVDDEPPDDSPTLGGGAVVGDEVWDPQARVRIRIGPLARERYDRFLPGGSAHGALKSIAEFFSDGQFDYELQLVLERDDVPGIVLGEEGEEKVAPLGWCTWIRTRPFVGDADQTTLAL